MIGDRPLKRPPRMEVRQSMDPDTGLTKLTIWDTTHEEILDCWLIEDQDDYHKFREEVRELFR